MVERSCVKSSRSSPFIVHRVSFSHFTSFCRGRKRAVLRSYCLLLAAFWDLSEPPFGPKEHLNRTTRAYLKPFISDILDFCYDSVRTCVRIPTYEVWLEK
jgi:hypothetical protein